MSKSASIQEQSIELQQNYIHAKSVTIKESKTDCW